MQPMDEIYQQYARIVYGFLLSRTRDEDLAEELTQETFFQAIRTSDRFDESCKVSTWLCAIAKNVLLSYRRKHPEMQELDQVLAPDPAHKGSPRDLSPAASPSSALSAASAEAQVLDSLGKLDLIRLLHDLPEPAREVMYLRVFGELSFAEIGAVHGKSENWARVTFFRAKERLRKDIEQ